MEYILLIKEIMKDNNINQKQLALTLGLSQSQVSELLMGKYKPSYDTILIICEKLKISPNSFFNFDTNKNDLDSIKSLTNEENQILMNFNKLDMPFKKMCNHYVDQLVLISASYEIVKKQK